MNKKFSTLVAALLVSGVSYAVVGTFNSDALTSSPIAKAATANLRSNTLVPAAQQMLLKKQHSMPLLNGLLKKCQEKLASICWLRFRLLPVI